MQINDTFRLYQKSAGRRPLRHSLRTGCAILAALCLAASAAWPQTCTVPPGVDQAPGGTNFFASFGSAANMGTYGTQLPIQNSGQVFEGDANSTYFSLYYSIANATALINSGNCPVELILVGSFPDARYFSITGYDMHYALAQKMLDADIDPAGPAYVDPFTPMTQYQTVQPYLVPISLGSLPGPMKPQGTVIPGCQIDPYEEDDLIDATQRHLSVDWNTIVQGSILTPSDNHVVDTASHINPNAAGDIVIRNYLAPAQTCGGDPITCTQPTAVPQPYLIVRDVYTGCAYSKTYVMNHLLAPPLGNVSPGNAIVATTDPSKNYPGQWLDQGQENDHLTFSLDTPQACFNNGSSSNAVAWVRSPEWVGRPAPDDSYIGAMVTPGLLQTMAANGQGIRMRFQLPSFPGTPCQPTGTAYDCKLLGSEQLRYWGLSFAQLPSSADSMVADPDGIADGSSDPHTIVSIADVAFSTDTAGYVTLVVGVGAPIPSTLTQGSVGAMKGAAPILNANGTYSVTTTSGGYTFLDLRQFSNFDNSQPLQLLLRNTLPDTQPGASPGPFYCSGSAIPFSTAEYTSAGGLMGPYVPRADYPVLGSLPLTPTTSSADLPSAAFCGQIPGLPSMTSNTAQVAWPTNWPSLNCGTATAPSPTIYFAATQPATLTPSTCGVPGSTCTNIAAPAVQTIETQYPPLPVAIVGTGFGFLPQILPFLLPSGTAGSSILQIVDDGASSHGATAWNSASSNCQVYIANWGDTGIWLAANLPIGTINYYEAAVSPLNDVGPLTFFPSTYTPPQNTFDCPVAQNDNLTITVGGVATVSAQVRAP